jgi:hypothetical protein
METSANSIIPTGEQQIFKSAAKCDGGGAGIIHLTNLRLIWTDGSAKRIHVGYADLEST